MVNGSKFLIEYTWQGIIFYTKHKIYNLMQVYFVNI